MNIERPTNEALDKIPRLWALIMTDQRQFIVEYNEEISREGGVSLKQGIFDTALLKTDVYKGKKVTRVMDRCLDDFFVTARGVESRNTKSSKVIDLNLHSPNTMARLAEFSKLVMAFDKTKVELCKSYYSRYRESISIIAKDLSVTDQQINRMKRDVRDIAFNCYKISPVKIKRLKS